MAPALEWEIGSSQRDVNFRGKASGLVPEAFI